MKLNQRNTPASRRHAQLVKRVTPEGNEDFRWGWRPERDKLQHQQLHKKRGAGEVRKVRIYNVQSEYISVLTQEHLKELYTADGRSEH